MYAMWPRSPTGFAPQTNIVRLDNVHGTLISILKNGDASTLDVVKGVNDLLPRIKSTLPKELKIQSPGRSIYIRSRRSERVWCARR